MRALGVLLLIVTSVAALTALAFGVMTAGTFHERYAHHKRERESQRVHEVVSLQKRKLLSIQTR